jgi:hypothetical protein
LNHDSNLGCCSHTPNLVESRAAQVGDSTPHSFINLRAQIQEQILRSDRLWKVFKSPSAVAGPVGRAVSRGNQ